MISSNQIQVLLNGNGSVVDQEGGKLGNIGQVYLDDKTSEPAWLTVKTGMFGGSESFVPLDQATVSGDDIAVPYDKEKVKDAPRVDSDGHIAPDEEAELYRYYGLDDPYAAASGRGTQDATNDRVYDQDSTGTDAGRDVTETGAAGTAGSAGQGQDTSGPNTDDAMTRSEEQLAVGTQTREAGKARLRKYIVTEDVTTTVPVSREEVRLEREPITEANRDQAMAGGDLTEEEHEVTLHEEQAVVDKQTVPVERVRLGTQTVTEDQQVTEQVRQERIDTDGVDTTGTKDDEPTR